MTLRRVFVLGFLPVTTQLSLRSDGDEVDDHDPVYDFGGFFEFVKRATEEQDSSGKSAGLVGEGSEGPWKAPLAPGDTYPGMAAWPLRDTVQCTADDMSVINGWALMGAKKTLPSAGRSGDFKTGSCYQANDSPMHFSVGTWSSCYQQFYNVSTSCATCIGAVYNMAKYNMSTKCYDFCKGRPHRKDGTHWCWEDCQACMYYVGKKLTDCYGEPYDMACRYSKELGKEGYFEKNGIDPKR